MKYEELVDQIQKGYLDDYYTQLLLHSEEILRAYRTRNQTQMGKELNIDQSKVSFLLKLLIAYSDLHNNE